MDVSVNSPITWVDKSVDHRPWTSVDTSVDVTDKCPWTPTDVSTDMLIGRVHGRPWTPSTGVFLVSLDVRGHVHGRPWTSMDFHFLFHRSPWKPMEVHGSPWNSMEFQNFSTEFRGVPWKKSMEVHGSSETFHGIPWNSFMVFHETFHGGSP